MLNKILIYNTLLFFLSFMISGCSILGNSYSSNPDKSTISSELGNYSSIPNEYKLIKYTNILSVSSVLVENAQNKQKIGIINTGIFFNLSKQNIENNIIDQKLKTLNSRIPFQIINLENLQILKKGYFKVNNQSVPYLKFKVNITGLTNCNLEGIIGVIQSKSNKNNIIFSINNPGKYDQKTAENFIKITAK